MLIKMIDIKLLKLRSTEGWNSYNKYCVGCHGRLANERTNAALGHTILEI